jgi:pyroglutamyl-peptidase
MRVLLTAFEPYGQWEINASWEALIALLSERGASPNVVTRRYPVDLARLRSRIETDLSQGIDAVLHLGQAPGISELHLEAVALNVAGVGVLENQEYRAIVEGAPIAYRTRLPIGHWANELNSIGIPASVSYHAGTYLCNAAMYLSHHWFERRQERPLVGFIHLPLTPEQVGSNGNAGACMSTQQTSRAIGHVIDRILTLQNEGPIQLA